MSAVIDCNGECQNDKILLTIQGEEERVSSCSIPFALQFYLVVTVPLDGHLFLNTFSFNEYVSSTVQFIN